MPLEVRWPFPQCPSLAWRVSSSLIMGMVGSYSYFWTKYMNSLTVHNREVLLELIDRRPADTPLITLSNHQSCMDDPHIWGVLKLRHLWTFNKMRWGWRLPEGDGFCPGETEQRGVGAHFPRSTVFELTRQNQRDRRLPQVKMGCRTPHRGVQAASCHPATLACLSDVLPNVAPYIPQIGKRITVLVGKPFSVRDLAENLRAEKKSQVETRKTLTDFIQVEFQSLKVRAESLHNQNQTES
ncbi:tafazzin isoform X5 [Nerophis ophidion]|uniref:tafazzin isoform X5 n=1 Tax=Nerophis ophidion TaxID=159077 RepID=UPI002ADF0964|nr:tafazzin isoform X5 [Nerophis ophidion]